MASDKEILTKLLVDHDLTVDKLAEQTGIPPWNIDWVLKGDHRHNNLSRTDMAALIYHFPKELEPVSFDWTPSLGREDRFVVREWASGYDVNDTVTNADHWLSDGVDVVSFAVPNGYREDDGDMLSDWVPYAGTFGMQTEWQEAFNLTPEETLEAYWPEQYAKETG